MKTNSAISRRTLGLVLLLIVWPAAVRAQDTNATLSGTVTDPAGAAIPKASLTVTNQATKTQVTVNSDEDGTYNFQNLTPGKYDLAASAAGFNSQAQKDIQLDTAQRGHADVHLAIGNAQEVVEVTQNHRPSTTAIRRSAVASRPKRSRTFPGCFGCAPVFGVGRHDDARRHHGGRG